MSLAPTRHILLADDDKDDSTLFQEVLEELSLPAYLTVLRNGEQLMQLLGNPNEQLPHILFLDLNMPRKNGFECLSEIKTTEKLRHLPVIIFTTSYDLEMVNLLYKIGAQYYIRKPNNYEALSKVISIALSLTKEKGSSQPPREEFILSSKSVKMKLNK